MDSYPCRLFYAISHVIVFIICIARYVRDIETFGERRVYFKHTHTRIHTCGERENLVKCAWFALGHALFGNAKKATVQLAKSERMEVLQMCEMLRCILINPQNLMYGRWPNSWSIVHTRAINVRRSPLIVLRFSLTKM